MFFETSRSALLTPLKMIAGVVERKQTLPILANALVKVEDRSLSLIATDSEIEVSYQMSVEAGSDGSTTLPALKLFDICRSLSDDAPVQVNLEEGESKAQVKSGRSRFSLVTLPAEDFPSSEELQTDLSFSLPQGTLKRLFAKTQYAMAQQDVRYYLNGLLMDLSIPGQLNVVATDGHRLALVSESFEVEGGGQQVIIPRKTVLELGRLLEDSDEPVEIALGGSHICFKLPQLTMRSKLIDGRFPDYFGVIPARTENELSVDCIQLKQALGRTVILSDERYKGVRLSLSTGHLLISVHNTEQEEAEEDLDADYRGDSLEIGFNAQYLSDALGAVDTPQVELYFNDPNSSCLLRPKGDESVKYVIMPMRL